MDDEWPSLKISLHQAQSLSTLDDILIMSKTKEEPLPHHTQSSKSPTKEQAILKAEKCEFDTLETKYLGVIISEGSIQMIQSKFRELRNGPYQPRNNSYSCS